MKKRLLGILMALVMVIGLLPVTAMAETGVSGETTYTLEDGTLTISGTGAMPANAFRGNTDIRTVVIKEGVTSIGNFAFYDCTSLVSVEIPASVTTIGNDAFFHCASLETVRYKGITVPSAGENAFSETAVNEVSVPEGYTGGTFAGLPVQKPTVYVGGVKLQSGKYLDNVGIVSETEPDGGYAHLSQDGKTLTLNNYEYDAENDYSSHAIFANSALTVVLKGENSLTSNRDGIYLSGSGSLIIEGEGSLTIKAEGAGIQTSPESSGVTINSGNIEIKAGAYGIYASQDPTGGGSVIINGGDIEISADAWGIRARVVDINDSKTDSNEYHTKVSVTVSEAVEGKYYAIYGSAGVTVDDDLTVTKSGDYGDILGEDDYGFYAKEVLIEKEEITFVEIGNAELSVGWYLSNEGELCSGEPEGGYAYLYEDDGELILELNDFSGEGLQSDQDLTLVLKGENKLERSAEESVIGVSVDGDLTIEGNGSLEVIVPHAGFSGIFAKGDIIVKSGDISVRSGSYGMVSYTDITISGGNLDIESEFGGGIFAKGDVNISGRNTEVTLKVKEGKEAIHTSDGTVTIGDGLKMTETESGVVVKTDTEASSGRKKSTPRYDMDVNTDDMENGSVKVSSRAKKGSTVTITVTPDEGYELDELIITDKDGDEIEWKDKGDGKYSFTMPKGDVEIEASFREIEEDIPAAEEKDETEIILTIDSKIVLVDGEAIVNDVASVIRDSRTFLPIRIVAEELGADVAWNEAEQTVTITEGDLEIVIFIGQPFATVNGEPVQLDAPAFIDADRTFLPVRFIAENLGAEVIWNGADSTVTVRFKE